MHSKSESKQGAIREAGRQARLAWAQVDQLPPASRALFTHLHYLWRADSSRTRSKMGVVLERDENSWHVSMFSSYGNLLGGNTTPTFHAVFEIYIFVSTFTFSFKSEKKWPNLI